MCMNTHSVNKPVRLVLFNKKKPVVDEPFTSVEMAKFYLGTIESNYQDGFITDQGVTVHSFKGNIPTQ